MAHDPEPIIEGWRRELGGSRDCVPLDRLRSELTPSELQHVASCPRCQAELRLQEEFLQSVPGADEAVVQQIAATLASRRRSSQVQQRHWTTSPWLRIAALVMIVAGIGYVVRQNRDRPVAQDTASSDAGYRSATIQIVAPKDDVRSVPSALEWAGVAGAVRYDATIREVDDTVLWTTSTTSPRAELPASVKDKLVPGKTVTWDVVARDGQGRELARTAVQRFRVTVRGPKTGD
jgi:hypothetical protein